MHTFGKTTYQTKKHKWQ